MPCASVWSMCPAGTTGRAAANVNPALRVSVSRGQSVPEAGNGLDDDLVGAGDRIRGERDASGARANLLLHEHCHRRPGVAGLCALVVGGMGSRSRDA